MRGVAAEAPLDDAIYPNGVTTAYTYDNLNRLTNLAATKTSTSTPITNFGYQYDAAGNRTQKSTLDFTEDYGYDPLYRLTRSERTPSPAVIASGGPLAVPRSNLWTYDAVGNRLSNQDNESVTTSTHNEKNQLLNSTGGGKMLWRGTLDEPGIATFSAPTINGQPARMLAGNVFEATLDLPAGANNVTIQAQDGSGNVATKVYSVNVIGVPSSYTYDANGNLAAKTEGADSWTYTWNALNQLTAVTKNAVSQATYSYDPMGRRVERLAGVTGTVWTYDQEDLLREGAAAAAVVTTTRFIHGPAIDEPMAQENASTAAVTYLHADALGSITRQTDAAGSAGGAITYDPWGKIQSGVPTLHAFTAREWDPAVQMHFYRARWYDQAQGRFASEDPVRFAAGVNFYTYTIGNPVRYEDPFGLDINVCFYADAAARAGHVGYGLPGEAGTEGFYSKRGVPFGDGAIKPDEQKEKTCKVIPAKPWQDDCMRSCRERRAKTPGKYNILSRQCTGFVRECLLECNLPSGDPYLIPPKDYFDTLPPPPPAPSKGK